MIEELSNKIKIFLAGKKAVKLAVALGVAGILLIFITGLSSDGDDAGEQKSCSDAQSYADSASAEISKVVSSITGERSPTVYVTVNSGSEKKYAVETKSDDDSQENTIVIIKNSDGDQTGLLLQELQPEVKGVVVVSSKADDPVIREKIIDAVKTAFDIPSNKVCVVSKYN